MGMKKEDIDSLINHITEIMNTTRLVWIEHSPLTLMANLEYPHGAVTQTGLTEDDLIPVQEWCEKTKCGVRTSFTMFKFKDRKEITAFLLVWG